MWWLRESNSSLCRMVTNKISHQLLHPQINSFGEILSCPWSTPSFLEVRSWFEHNPESLMPSLAPPLFWVKVPGQSSPPIHLHLPVITPLVNRVFNGPSTPRKRSVTFIIRKAPSILYISCMHFLNININNNDIFTKGLYFPASVSATLQHKCMSGPNLKLQCEICLLWLPSTLSNHSLQCLHFHLLCNKRTSVSYSLLF